MYSIKNKNCNEAWLTQCCGIFVGIKLAVITREIPEIVIIIKFFGAHLVGSMSSQILQGWLGKFTADFDGT